MGITVMGVVFAIVLCIVIHYSLTHRKVSGFQFYQSKISKFTIALAVVISGNIILSNRLVQAIGVAMIGYFIFF